MYVLSTVNAVMQYKGMAELQEKYSPQGFDVFAFPCNQVPMSDRLC